MKLIDPIHDKIVVKPEEVEEKEGLIIIPEKGRKRPVRAKVLAVGTGMITETGAEVPLKVKVGQMIIIPEYGGAEIDIADHGKCLMIREQDVFGICKD